MISVAESIIPTITAALIPATIPENLFGIAYGIITVFDNVIGFFFDILYGASYNLTGSYDCGLHVLHTMSIMGFIILLIIEYVINFHRARRNRNYSEI